MKTAIILHNHLTGLGVIRALAKKNVPLVAISYEESEMGRFSHYLHNRLRSPDPAKSENAFVSFLMNQSSWLKGGVLIPCDDSTLVVVSKHKEILSSEYVVAAPEWSIVKKIIIKKHTYKLAKRLKIPHPKTVIVNARDDLGNYINQFSFPCLIKPLEIHKFFELFRAKAFKVRNLDDLIQAYERSRRAGLQVMIQEFIPGDDSCGVNYNSYFWEGTPIAEFTAQKLRLTPPVLGVPRVLVSREIPEVIEQGRAILGALGFYGYSCMEFKRDPRDGIYKLFEINGRNNRSTLLAVKCGMNFPWLMYCHLTTGNLFSLNSPKQGVYWIDILKDVRHILDPRKEESWSILDYLRPYFLKKVFAVADVKDPLPFIYRLYYVAKKLCERYLKYCLEWENCEKYRKQ